MNNLRYLVCAISLALPLGHVIANPIEIPAIFKSSENADSKLTQALDVIAARYYQAEKPGATLIVMKDGKVLLRKAYGLANIEAKEALTPEHVMKIGSMTKQFTAVAIMQLVEQGKIALNDPITKYFPEFPSTAQKISIEHLLTHTSGIPSFTSKPDFFDKMDLDISVQQRIDSFKNDPLEFEPGTAFSYNNSGYLLLGALIERISKESYANYLAKHIFTPLDMKDSAYGGYARRPAPTALPYSVVNGSFQISKKISMTQPHAAGALISTVDDLAKWGDAIQTRKLLKPESWRRIFTPYKLSDGQSTGYGYGWFIEQNEGQLSFSHGGDISGFSAMGISLPSENIYVAVLSNSDQGAIPLPNMVALRLIATTLGKPLPDYKPVTLSEKTLDQYVGVYKINDNERRYIARDGDKLVMTRTNGPTTILQAYKENGFFVNEQTLLNVEFLRDEKGQVSELSIYQRGSTARHPKTNEALPKKSKRYGMSEAEFDAFVGEYQVMPNMVLSVKRDGKRFLAQVTGQGETEIFAIGNENFEVPLIDGKLKFEKNSAGQVTQVILTQSGQNIPAKRIN